MPLIKGALLKKEARIAKLKILENIKNFLQHV